jgi:hypothetical protein
MILNHSLQAAERLEILEAIECIPGKDEENMQKLLDVFKRHSDQIDHAVNRMRICMTLSSNPPVRIHFSI